MEQNIVFPCSRFSSGKVKRERGVSEGKGWGKGGGYRSKWLSQSEGLLNQGHKSGDFFL